MLCITLPRIRMCGAAIDDTELHRTIMAAVARDKWSTGPPTTIPLHLVGVSGAVSSYYVHIYMASIKHNGTLFNRLGYPIVVEVPPEYLAEFRACNKQLWENDKKLPQCHPEMKYALLTKAFLVTALKLFAAGYDVEYDVQGTVITGEIIARSVTDAELDRYIKHGIPCEVLQAGIWLHDNASMHAITNHVPWESLRIHDTYVR